jgi:ketosteroid isomerase-like protein
MSEQANIEFIKLCYDAYTKGDAPRLLSYMAPDVEWEIPEMPGMAFSGKRRGHAEVAEFFRLVSEGQELRRFALHEFFAHGDRVVVLGTNDWTIRANGVDLSADFAHIFTVKDGKVTSFRQMLDTHQAVEAHALPARATGGPAWSGALLHHPLQAPPA